MVMSNLDMIPENAVLSASSLSSPIAPRSPSWWQGGAQPWLWLVIKPFSPRGAGDFLHHFYFSSFCSLPVSFFSARLRYKNRYSLIVRSYCMSHLLLIC